MKTFFLLVLTVVALFVWQRGAEKPSAAAGKARLQTQTAPSTVTSPVSEHNWAKHSLDRAHAVADQVRASRQSSEQP